MRCKFLSGAKQDLRAIAHYIARDNPVRAKSYIQEIERSCYELATMPGMGRVRPEFADNLRSMPFGSYVIFYSVHEDEIHIEHILHGARDIGRFFRE